MSANVFTTTRARSTRRRAKRRKERTEDVRFLRRRSRALRVTHSRESIMSAGGPANSTNVLALYMYPETFQNFRYGFGAAIAVILLLISLALIFVYLRNWFCNQ